MAAAFNKVDSLHKLDAVIAESHLRPVILFKHSNSCGISADVRSQLHQLDGDINEIVVQESRSVSSVAAEKLGKRHASPQLFVLRNGLPIYHATHYGIDSREIEEHLKGIS